MTVAEALALARVAGNLANELTRPRTQIKDHGTKVVKLVDPIRYAWERVNRAKLPACLDRTPGPKLETI